MTVRGQIWRLFAQQQIWRLLAQEQIWRLLAQEDVNFLLANRIPRRLATQFVGWLSQIEQPLVRDLSIGLWRLFCDLDLSEAKKTHFRSMHDCFTRELKEGARPIDGRTDIGVANRRRHH